MKTAENKHFHKPDVVREFEKGKVELVHIGAGEVGRLTLHPGWQWSKHVKPIAKTDWCEAPHSLYVVSGKGRVKMAGGEEFDLVPGQVSVHPSGHDAWVVGDEPLVMVDWNGAKHYAEK
jgi:mannose-6-phosphate isomerase-like protein (cupin superfamily)